MQFNITVTYSSSNVMHSAYSHDADNR